MSRDTQTVAFYIQICAFLQYSEDRELSVDINLSQLSIRVLKLKIFPEIKKKVGGALGDSQQGF